jgi:hypothetical protein
MKLIFLYNLQLKNVFKIHFPALLGLGSMASRVDELELAAVAQGEVVDELRGRRVRGPQGG